MGRVEVLRGNMSGRIFKFVIHFAAEYGQVEYDVQHKSFRVLLDDQEKRQAVEKYLSKSHQIHQADGDDLQTFHTKTVVPTDNLESFKMALTRLWQHTGIYVDWSRPTV